jgi:hypothetical protein
MNACYHSTAHAVTMPGVGMRNVRTIVCDLNATLFAQNVFQCVAPFLVLFMRKVALQRVVLCMIDIIGSCAFCWFRQMWLKLSSYHVAYSALLSDIAAENELFSEM